MIGEKKKLFVIGKSKKPRSFNNVKELPVDYDANKTAWIFRDFFVDWLKKWDLNLHIEDRKILLLIDHCTAHENLPAFKRIKIVYLPASTTLLFKPYD